jgi:hypothetical protein
VNLIHQPNGDSKQVGIRKNSIYHSQTALLLCFTDTLENSSGEPVFDDFWKVVALHRGFRPIENFDFQGTRSPLDAAKLRLPPLEEHIIVSDL